MSENASVAGQKWVLVVEDSDEDFRLFLRASSEYAHRYRFVHAETAASAVRELSEQSTRPSLILLDYRLPGMSGLELMSLLGQGSGLPAPVVIMSNADEALLLARNQGLKIDDFLLKPIHYLQFMSEVSELLGRWL